MAGKQSKRAMIYLEYAVFMAVAGILRILPFSIAAIVGTFFARGFCAVSRRSSKFIKYQMKACFHGKYSDSEYDKLVKKFYSHFGHLFAEAVRLKLLTKENGDSYVDWKDFQERVSGLTEQCGTGVFFATGHIGNWEFTGAAGAVKGVLAGSIARPLDNPLINKKVTEFREFSGQEIWDKDGAVLKLLRAIRNKKSVGVLIDQDAGEQGLKVPFLGRASSTNTAVAEMAIRLGAPILPCAIVRDNSRDMKFKIVYGEAVIPASKASNQEDIYIVMEQVNKELSKIIEAYPEQWLWIHKRWKTPNPSDGRRYRRAWQDRK